MHALIENSSSINLGEAEQFTAIIGLNPSKGARSPLLWNAAFERLGIDCRMVPLDVKEKNLGPLIQALRKDNRFLGGSVAVPYKEEIVGFLDRIEPEIDEIGAVNCIYRECGTLVGGNTDGEGAVRSLLAAIEGHSVKGSTAMIVGIGGAGLSVAAFISRAIGKDGNLFLASRNPTKIVGLARKLSRWCPTRAIASPPEPQFLDGLDVFINCTVVGSGEKVAVGTTEYIFTPYTPLASVSVRPLGSRDTNIGNTHEYMSAALNSVKENLCQSLEALSFFKPKATVFDIIYQPESTILLKIAELYGYNILNGRAMNLEQAAIGFSKVRPDVVEKIGEIRTAMNL